MPDRLEVPAAFQNPIHAVLFHDRGWWVAQALEVNLVGSSRVKEEASANLRRVLEVQIEIDEEAGIEPFSRLHPAPRRFWHMHAAARAATEPAEVAHG